MSKVHLCGAILDKNGTILLIDNTIDEKRIWVYRLGWPTNQEIAEAKANGERFAIMEVREKAHAD